MCGIAGIFSTNQIEPWVIQSMTDSLAHRGPDAQVTYLNNSATVALGHTRLSIIDLSPSANQPMRSPDGRYVIIFNGEIYNFKRIREELLTINASLTFNTSSDTEVVLQAFIHWGQHMVSKLEGMFSIVIYDSLSRTTYFFCDRLGKKPFFYYQGEGLFVIASEIKSLLKHPRVKSERSVNSRALNNFLTMGFIPGPDSIFQSIKKFPQAHGGVLTHDLQLTTWKYWELSSFIEKKTFVNDQEVKSNLLGLIERAVEMRMISDVPLGVFLSGGTDSSLIASLASKMSTHRLKTFNIGFKEAKFDESKFAFETARLLNTEHYQYTISEKDALEMVESCFRHFDEPFADTSAIPTMLVSKLAKQEVTVALTGDGGDEFFLGYGRYDWANRLESPLVKALQSIIHKGLGFGNNKFKRVSSLFEEIPENQIRSHIFSQEQFFFSSSELINKLLVSPPSNAPFIYEELNSELRAAERQAIFDILFYLKDDLLVKVDRASMRFALECRCPLLDQQVVEFALQLPYHYKKRSGVRKWVLKELLGQYLPQHMVHRKKQGFSIPLASWMKNELRYLIDKYLSDENVLETGLCKVSYVNELKERFYSRGEDHLCNRVWVLMQVHKWLNENGQ